MSSPIDLLYEPFSHHDLAQPFDPNLKCAGCGAFYSMDCPLREQNLWSCLFCSRSNPMDRTPLVSSDAYTLTSERKGTFERRTVMVIDAVCGPHELDHLIATLCNAAASKDSELTCVITIQDSGSVTVHNTVGQKRNAVFSIDDFMTHYNLDKLNVKHFEKKLRATHSTSYWFAHDSLKKQLQEISKTAKEGSKSKRGKRCTGLALFIASILASQCALSTCCHIVSFLNGPCTKGAGEVLSRERRKHMRQNYHFDSENPNSKLSRSSWKFYEELFKKFKQQKSNYEFFISSLDQIGLLEMGPLVNSSMAVSQFDSFNDERFVRCFQKYLRLRNENAIYNCKMKILTAENTSIVYEIPDYVLNPKNLSLPVEISLDNRSTKNSVQLQITFENSEQAYTKIETFVLPAQPKTDLFQIQKIIAIAMKKMASQITGDFDYSSKHTKELNKQLASLLRQVQGIDKDKIIEWCYYLYKSPILSSRNTSPDERYLFLHQVLNSSRNVCLSLCKPLIWNYNDSKHDWVVLDISLARTPMFQDGNTTLCIDGGSYVILRIGERFQREGQEFCCKLLNDLQRFTQPLYVETEIGGSQDRFLKSKIVPFDASDKKILDTEDMTFRDFFNLYTSSTENK
ncbi:hypothetical protein SEUBUCD646_0O02030 [Saccharomyces eubayanus]|uniref:Protein transport protein SEC23 n=2 Tax=Saccharomyces TaxID=4930 RepID=A0A6C1EF41_SACPS|nr:hypothetical protein GRS66_010722 [Saccharomyces pastorianus]CAI1719998.1 hypothetical protein SEUBUCD650_0O02020 [Saccharomyces eubayanus]CAI1754227.1 hypothetical protein SEUBUCD646_0O02030 [Saccharomyces eubayanus]